MEGTVALANLLFPAEKIAFVSFGLFLPQGQLLKELEHRVTQEALHRQQLDLMKTSSMEKLLEDVEQKEQHLQLLTEEAERASKLGQLQQKKIQRELQQVRTPVRGANQSAPARAGLFSPVLPVPLMPSQCCSSPLSPPDPPAKWSSCSSCLG